MRDISIVKDNILKYLEYKGITKYEFYKSTGISNGILSQKNGMSEENTLKVLSYFKDINPVWLFLSRGDMIINEESLVSELKSHDRHLIPLYDTIATAGRQQEVDMTPVTEPAEYIDAGDWFRDATAAMRIHGDSMYPVYHSGCIAALKEVKQKNLIMYGEDYVIETVEYRTLKRIQKGKDEQHLLACSANIERWEDGSVKGRLIHEPFDVHKDEIRRLFLVLGAVRRNHSSRIVFNR